MVAEYTKTNFKNSFPLFATLETLSNRDRHKFIEFLVKIIRTI
jgi:hypothetical protein